MDQRVRVAVQSTDHLSLAGLTSYLAGRSEVVLVGQRERAGADVAVVAVPKFTEEVTSRLRRAATEAGTPVVLVLDEVGDADVLTAAECRVVAIVPRTAATGDRVLRSVLAAAEGGGVMPPNLVAELLRHVQRLQRELVATETGPDRLTSREADVLRLIAEGLDTAEIATRLSYSERTVKNVFYGITTRLHLRNRPHAVAYALRKGMI
ncbi:MULTISPECIES: helix-turn-helix transcriptional regulator [Actinosynnema]|uniref:Helix-turn-helix transcriptional regulator n=1 Tax=Actinosynnema pretiosum TaxID=42197 RepID=A0A290ZGP7_9PSEU|nr:response regulator transcription factor [Actinosynnema pretiosum]ATE58176.1 helix-turn-helix transcriptional regulator [Actinosynnema pretiosum]